MISESRCSVMTKQQLRKDFLEKRKSLTKSQKRNMDLEIQSRLIMCDSYRLCDSVLIYVSKADEIDTFGIINAAFANKKRVAVPVTNDDFSLTFYYINSIEELSLGKFNVLEPIDKSSPVCDYDNSICVVPALCCDLSGARVGYGKGCYDRFLSSYTGEKICLTYAEHILPSIESDDADIRCDMIVSDMFVKHT